MTDELVKTLNAHGYVPVFLPKTGLKPPDLYSWHDKRLRRRGPLQAYLPAAAKLQTRTGKVAAIEHRMTSSKRSQAAASFLTNALACIGVHSAPKLDLSFAGNEELVFGFSDITYVASEGLDHALASLDLGAIPEHEIAQGGLHIAYEYLYAGSLLLTRGDRRAFEVDVNGANISDFLELGAQAEVSTESNTAIRFASRNGAPAAFAYKAGRLVRGQSRWEFYPERVPRGFGATDASPYLVARGQVLQVEDEEP